MSDVAPPKEHILAGALFVTAAAFMFASVGVFVKLATVHLPSTVAVFFRNIFGLLVLLPWLRKGGWSAMATSCPGWHLLRLATGLSAMYLYFFALSKLPLTEVLLLNFSAPLFIPFVARIWLREPIPRGVLLAVAMGFLGVCCVLHTSLGAANWGTWAALVSALFAAGTLVTVRRLGRTEPAARVVCYFSVGATLVSAVPLLHTWVCPTPIEWVYLFAAGGCATAGQLFVTLGYKRAPAARAGTFHYSAVLFAALYAWAIWGDVPNGWTWCGALLIAGAGVLASWRAGLPAAPLYSGGAPAAGPGAKV
jgi:drug/metabolite transporter (DMT)-like permease